MVDSTPNRVVFRSAYKQPHSTITQAGETGVNVKCEGYKIIPGIVFPQIDGIDVEVIHMAVFFRQKWAVVMLDTSAACTIGNTCENG